LNQVGEFYVLGNANNQGVVNLNRQTNNIDEINGAADLTFGLAGTYRFRRQIARIKRKFVLVISRKLLMVRSPHFFINQMT